ncbi:hypothetical protein GCM10023215_34550 [Pseudonocardia yuanmonensis]|uniref:Pentapeptide repeat protein n=1 Tax=Pseudonocardia yuanmonensis TaxID=1095914 RepID=A0ABP8WTZ2_9PSEU
MAEVPGASHSGLQITDVSLTDSRFSGVEVVDASFRRVRMRGVWIGEVEIDGHVADLRINR